MLEIELTKEEICESVIEETSDTQLLIKREIELVAKSIAQKEASGLYKRNDALPSDTSDDELKKVIEHELYHGIFNRRRQPIQEMLADIHHEVVNTIVVLKENVAADVAINPDFQS